MTCLPFALLAVVLFQAGSAAPAVEVRIDHSLAPEASSREQGIRSLIQEWYPKIEALLSGPADLPAFPAIDVVVKPMKKPARAIRNTIYINPPVLTSPDFDRVLIHELAHIVQDYRYDYKKRGEWVVEGIADYVAYGTWEGVLQPKLPLEPATCDRRRAFASIRSTDTSSDITSEARFYSGLSSTRTKPSSAACTQRSCAANTPLTCFGSSAARNSTICGWSFMRLTERALLTPARND